MENTDIRVLVGLRQELDEILDDFRKKISRIEEIIESLDSVIGAGSFSTADTALSAAIAERPAATTTEAPSIPDSTIVHTKARDMELATIKVEGNELRVIPASHALYDIKRGAFARFFVERILGQFQQQDRQRVENGEITWEEAFDFEVVAEDGILQEVVIKNFGTEERFMEIQRTVRWALEKTYRAR